MKNYEVEDIKNFMNDLLVQEKYDSFYLFEARIKTALDYYINGKINEDFFDNEDDALAYIGEGDNSAKSESGNEKKQRYVYWSNVKHTVFDIIKGERLPLSFKLVLMFNRENILRLVEMNNLPISAENVSALSMNIYYENGALMVTTGTSINVFTLDKTLEHLWDETVEKYYI